MGRTADFSGVGDYKPVAAGTYEAEYVRYEWKTPKSADAATDEDGNKFDYANTRLNITDELDSAGEKAEGKVVFTTYSLNPKALWKLRQDAIASGAWNPEDLEAVADVDVILGRMMGRKVNITVTVQSFTRGDGSVRLSNNVEKVEALEVPMTAISAGRRG